MAAFDTLWTPLKEASERRRRKGCVTYLALLKNKWA